MTNLDVQAIDAPSLLGEFKRWIGLDRAIGFTILARSWSSLAGFITILLISRLLTPDEQGYYYTFGSLVAIQIVFELGFSYVIQQMASHERAHLEILETGEVSGPISSHARLASVLQKAIRWYSVTGGLLFCGLLPLGTYFFSVHNYSTAHVQWQGPWMLDVFAATLAFMIDPIFSFLEGCGYVPQVAHTRFFQALTGSLLAWLSLSLHCGLYAPSMMILGQVLVGACMVYKNRSLLSHLYSFRPGQHQIEWLKEVWPFQWRIAVSWISGYFIFQLFNPMLFALRGPAAAGQLGMSLSIASAIMAVGISWISTKSAPFGMLIARKQFRELDRLFFRSLAQSWLVCLLGCTAAWTVVFSLYHFHFAFTRRILPPSDFLFLLLTILENHIVASEAYYLRAHKQEVFLDLSVINAILMTLSTYLLGRYMGARGMMIGYFLVNLVIGLALGSRKFLRYRRVWHEQY